MKSLQSLTLDFCLKLIVGFALLLHCSSVNSIQITHYHSHVDEIMLPTLQLSDGLLNVLKKPIM